LVPTKENRRSMEADVVGTDKGKQEFHCHLSVVHRISKVHVFPPKTNSVGLVRFEVFTAVTMKNGVFWVRRLLATASVVPSSPILVTLMKEALSSS
jgi:hypothetical protein